MAHSIHIYIYIYVNIVYNTSKKYNDTIIYIYIYICTYIYIYISTTSLARMACPGCVFFSALCVSRMLLFCVFTVGMSTVGMFTVGLFIVGMFTVGLVLFVLKGVPPLLHRGNDVCPVLVSYFSNDCLMYFWHMFFDGGSLSGIHARNVFHHFGITFLNIVFK